LYKKGYFQEAFVDEKISPCKYQLENSYITCIKF
jgi:hypothetical protein